MQFLPFNNIKKIIKNFDVIIPLAALVGAPLCKQQPKNAHEINYLSTKKIIDELSKDQIVLMPTTNSAYGSGNKDNFCDEKTELKPISDYAVVIYGKIYKVNEILFDCINLLFRFF